MPPTVPDLPAFDLKSRAWTLTVLRVHTTDPTVLSAALAVSTEEAPGLFEHEPVCSTSAAWPGRSRCWTCRAC